MKAPGERWTCECGERLIGGLTPRGRVAPITVDSFPDGNVLLQPGEDGKVRAFMFGDELAQRVREVGAALRRNHAWCPVRDHVRAA